MMGAGIASAIGFAVDGGEGDGRPSSAFADQKNATGNWLRRGRQLHGYRVQAAGTGIARL